MSKKYRSKVMAAIHETAVDLHRVGGMDKKTMRKFDALCLPPIQAMTQKSALCVRVKTRAATRRGSSEPHA